MTDDELQNEAERLHNLFHSMPNNDDRKWFFVKWAQVRAEQTKRLYSKKHPDGKRFKNETI